MPKGGRSYGKKRPRGFGGIQKQFVQRVDPAGEALSEEESLAPPSASKRKIESPTRATPEGFTSGTCPVVLRSRPSGESPGSGQGSSERSNWILRGNRIVPCDSLVSLVSMVRHCPQHPLSISEDRDTVRGLVTRITVKCGCGWTHHLTDSYKSSHLSLNARSVFAMRLIGKGEVSLHTFCAVMDLPAGMKTQSYRKHVRAILDASNDAVRAEHLNCSEELCTLYSDGQLYIPPPIEDDEPCESGDEPCESGDEPCESGDEPCESGDEPCESGDEPCESGDEPCESGDDQSGCEPDSSMSPDGSDPSDSGEGEGESDGEECDENTILTPIWTTEPLDVTVTFDGTWSKRGFTALYGIVVVISWDTGRVLDSHLMSRHCGVCARQRRKLDSEEDFQEWYDFHESECAINHTGSAPVMETEGALVLWRRSVEFLNLRYVNVISDGDSKAIKAVQDDKPYGDGITIEKYECVGHVQKRVGAGIIKLKANAPMEPVTVVVKKAVKARKATKKRPAVKAQREVTKVVMKKVQIGGKGGITIGNAVLLQRFYGNAIRGNAGHLDDMVKACWAVFEHSISTDDAPQHGNCPKGEGSWGECKSWTLDSGLDHGLDYGLEYGLNSRLIFKLLAMVTSQDLD